MRDTSTSLPLFQFNRDAYGVPNATNLYGAHPIYQEHRETGTHGVLLLNSNGMDIKLNQTDGQESTLEYNVVGGILDLYFFAGSESDPAAVARQYAELVGLPAEYPYWGYGLHQCRYGYTGTSRSDFFVTGLFLMLVHQTSSTSPRSSRTILLLASLSRRCGRILVSAFS